MKSFIYLLILLIMIGCSTKKSVNWCGDHECINNDEKEDYFKKTMTIEIKNLYEDSSKILSESEKIIQLSKNLDSKDYKNEKHIIKQTKLEKKRKIKERKLLLKQQKSEIKKRLKEQKRLAKQNKILEKKTSKQQKISIKEPKIDEIKIIKKKIVKKTNEPTFELKKSLISSSNFEKLVEDIIKRNSSTRYPDINDIPN